MLWHVDPALPAGLSEQIAASVRRAITDGSLEDGARLPTAAELARVLGVNANTVLAAYRRLRDEGVLEFRRGRGVTVRIGDRDRAVVVEAARRLLEIGRAHGYSTAELADLVGTL